VFVPAAQEVALDRNVVVLQPESPRHLEVWVVFLELIHHSDGLFDQLLLPLLFLVSQSFLARSSFGFPDRFFASSVLLTKPFSLNPELLGLPLFALTDHFKVDRGLLFFEDGSLDALVAVDLAPLSVRRLRGLGV